MAVLEGAPRADADRILGRYPEGRERSAVLPLLYLCQSIEGRVTDDGMREVAQLLGITTAEVRAVATFYTMLRTERTGRHVVCVCTNLSCALRGANDLLAAAREAVAPDHSGTDADGDGHDALSAGGDDCDDADASVYPGASDAWYDGVDSNCEGDHENGGDHGAITSSTVAHIVARSSARDRRWSPSLMNVMRTLPPVMRSA